MTSHIFKRDTILSFSLLMLSILLSFAACSLPTQKLAQPNCALTVPVFDVRNNSTTIGLALLCFADREEWVAYTNTTSHDLSAVRICAQALNPSGTAYVLSYCL